MATGLTYVNQVGAVEGMNQAAPGTLIPDTFVRWSQDVLFDRAGLIRRRGPIESALTTGNLPAPAAENAAHNERVIGVSSCLNPQNERVLAIIAYGNQANNPLTLNNTKLYFYKPNAATGVNELKNTSTLAYSFDSNTTVDSKPALGGGAWIGLLEKYGVSNTTAGTKQALYYWRGGVGVENTTGLTGTINNNTGVITGVSNAATNITSGMFVYSGNYWIGIVKSVASNGTITMEKRPILYASAGVLAYNNTAQVKTNFYFKNVRPYIHRHGRGLATKTKNSAGNADIVSGDTGTSAWGHWSAAKVQDYRMYRASDYAPMGFVHSDYSTDSSKVNKTIDVDPLNGDYTITLAADEYILINETTVPSPLVADRTATNFTGVFNATYAGLQWFGCLGLEGQTNRIVFSASHDPEAVDLSKDSADSIIIPGVQEMRGIAASSSGLVVLMEDKTYLIRGNTRANFSLELLYPQGCVCGSSIIETGGGVMWASRAGLLYYDGATVRNLTSNNLGVYYSDGLSKFNPQDDNCYSFIYRDYVFFHFTNWSSSYGMTRYEPVYAGKWANSVYSDDNTIVDAGAYAADGLANQSWSAFNDDDYSWYEISTAVNAPIGWDYEEEVPTNITFAVYLPTGAVTTISNFTFSGAMFKESVKGLEALIGVTLTAASNNVGTRCDLLDIDSMLDSVTDGYDHALLRNGRRIGPDLYMQTKHYTVGDPTLRKWFQRMLMNLLLERGAVRVDFIDAEDNDAFNVFNLKHKNWEVFTEKGYTWQNVQDIILPKLVSPAAATWGNLEDPDSNAGTSPPYTWNSLLFADYERQSKRFSLRQTSVGFRLYQLNKYRDPYQTSPTIPRRIQTDSWNIGYKPLRGGRL